MSGWPDAVPMTADQYEALYRRWMEAFPYRERALRAEALLRMKDEAISELLALTDPARAVLEQWVRLYGEASPRPTPPAA